MTDITESDIEIESAHNLGIQPKIRIVWTSHEQARLLKQQILQNQKDAQEYRKIKDESVILKKQDIEKEIQLLIDTTKLPSEPNKIRNEIIIEYLRKLLGKCYCGLEFNKH